MKKYHLGARIGEDLTGFLTDHTRKLTDAALWAQVRDVVAGAFERAKFDALVQQIQGTTDRRIEGDPIQVVEVTRRIGRSESSGSSTPRSASVPPL
jgi:cytochrome P450